MYIPQIPGYTQKQSTIVYGFTVAGNVAGIITAISRKSGFWGYVGWIAVGGMAGSALGMISVGAFGIGAGTSSSQPSISQEEADGIANQIFQLYENANAERGGISAYENTIKNEMVTRLGEGGYSYIKGKAVKK